MIIIIFYRKLILDIEKLRSHSQILGIHFEEENKEDSPSSSDSNG